MIKKKPENFSKTKISLTLLLVMCIVNGCWDWKEIKNISFVSGIGIDLNKDDSDKELQLTLEIMKAQKIQSGEDSKESGDSSGNKPRFLLKGNGHTIYEAINNIGNKSSRDLKFTHTLVLLLGPKIIREGLGNHLDFFIYDPNPRPRQWVVVSRNSLEELFQVTPNIEGVVSMTIAEFMNSDKISYAFNPIALQKFLQILLEEKESIAIPMVEIDKSGKEPKIVFERVAILYNRKYVGEFTLLEFRGAMWLLQNMNAGTIEIQKSPNEWISLRLDSSDYQLSTEFNGKKPKVKANVKAEFTLIGQTDESEQARNKLEKQVESLISREIKRMFHRLQAQNADIYNFKELFYKHDYRKNANKSSYNSLFRELQLSLQVKAKIHQSGRSERVLKLNKVHL